MSKSGGWIIALGALVIFLSLCVLPSALGEHRDADMLAMAGCLFSLGAIVVSTGIYVKARALHSATESGEWKKEPSSNRRPRGACELCGSEAPVVQCRTHQLHMCGACLAQHYDVRSCAYVPSSRGVGAKTEKNMAARAR